MSDKREKVKKILDVIDEWEDDHDTPLDNLEAIDLAERIYAALLAKVNMEELWIVRAKLDGEDFGKEWVYLVRGTGDEVRALVRANHLGFPMLDLRVSKFEDFVVMKRIGYSSWGARE